MPQTRTLVIHHDDLGGSHGANMAFVTLCDLGIVTSGSVMVPCPWFPELAAIARSRPDLDIGVHLTLNAEFASFRWRPLTGVADNGLCDPDGFFWRDVASARGADPAAVERELRLQIDTALSAGIDVTHLDSHMGTVWQPEFLDIYLRLGAEYRLPIAFGRMLGSAGADPAAVEDAITVLARSGNPIFEAFLLTPFGQATAEAETYRRIFDETRPGLNWGAFHPVAPGDMGFISDDAGLRISEYALFQDGTAKAIIDELGLELIGMRSFREAMRG